MAAKQQHIEMQEKTIRVGIVDDHPLVRQGLSELLGKHHQLTVVGTAKNFQGVLGMLEANRPDVILMDVNMPGMNGIQMTQAVLERYPNVSILMLTSHEEEDIVVEALDVGARGVVMKDTEISELVSAITATYNGKRFLSPQALEMLIHHKTTAPHPDEVLTERELEVLQLMVQGMTNPQIADMLFVALSTVKYHTGSIYKKLNVATRTEAVSTAIARKLINDER